MILPPSVDQLSDRDASDKLGTPVQSIDSAVESLDDSPDSHNRHSSARHSGEQLASGSNGKYGKLRSLVVTIFRRFVSEFKQAYEFQQ